MLHIEQDAVALLILCSCLFISTLKSERGVMISMILSMPFIVYLLLFTSDLQSCFVLVLYALLLGVRRLYLLPDDWYVSKWLDIFSINLWCAFQLFLLFVIAYLLINEKRYKRGLYYQSSYG